MNKASVTNVTYGKPAVGGAIFVAPLGSVLPTDAKSELNPAFKALGYVSTDGLENENKIDTDGIKAWGGDTVIVVQKAKEDDFKLTLIEALNIDVLKTVYGADNVTGSIDSGVTIKSNSRPLADICLVVDMVFRNGILKRIVAPNASVKNLGTIKYKDDDFVGYQLTLAAKPDSEGNTHYEYLTA